MCKTFTELVTKCAQDMHLFRAGGLKKCYSFWEAHCQDPDILKLISGLPIPVIEPIFQPSIPRETTFSSTENYTVQQEIAAFLLDAHGPLSVSRRQRQCGADGAHDSASP